MTKDQITKFGLILLIIVALPTIGVAITGAMQSTGEVDYCYVEMTSSDMGPQFRLLGHRPWRNDLRFGVYATVDEAKQKADVLGCKMGVRP